MTRLGGVISRLLVLAALAALLMAACDPGSKLTVQIRNRTDRTIRVAIPVMIGMSKGPPLERLGIDVSIEPETTGEADMGMSMGSWPGPVRAYADGRLIFCQDYVFTPQESVGNSIGTSGGSRATYSVEIVDGHIAPGCQDPDAPSK